MPGLARKLVIVAAVNGLIIQPVDSRPRGGGRRDAERGASDVFVDYKSHKPSRWLGSEPGYERHAGRAEHGKELEVYGIIGA